MLKRFSFIYWLMKSFLTVYTKNILTTAKLPEYKVINYGFK
jgi:hypothetical protein